MSGVFNLQKSFQLKENTSAYRTDLCRSFRINSRHVNVTLSTANLFKNSIFVEDNLHGSHENFSSPTKTWTGHRLIMEQKYLDNAFRIKSINKAHTERAALGSDNIAIVILHFFTTSAGVFPTEAPSFTSSSHCKSLNQSSINITYTYTTKVLASNFQVHITKHWPQKIAVDKYYIGSKNNVCSILK